METIENIIKLQYEKENERVDFVSYAKGFMVCCKVLEMNGIDAQDLLERLF